MATCPKCSTHLSPLRWAPTCPNCHVNIMYYDMEQRLSEDADRAEAEAERFSRWGKRIKAVSVGSPLAIVRLLSFLLPILAALLPFGRAKLLGLGLSEPVGVSLISVIQGLMKGAGSMGSYLNFSNDGKILFGALLLLLTAVCALGGMIACAFSYGKHGRGAMLGFLIAGFLVSLLSGVLLLLGGASLGAGWFVSLASFAVCIILAKVAADKIETE